MKRWNVPARWASCLFCAAILLGTLRGSQAQDWDFGDAPDGPYPTVQASTGACHAIVLWAPWLGDATDFPDPESDGQPHPNALGDDLLGTPTDDEDGVVIPNPLVVGVPATINVTVNGPAGGWLDAWVDWNTNGIWETSECICSNAVTPGLLAINVTAPGPFTGQTFARFRISSQGGLPPTGPAPDGEVEDHAVLIEAGQTDWKWRQPPDLTTNGFDVACRRDGVPPILLADDFRCTANSTITNIVVWGSWLYDKLPPGANGGPDPSNVVFTLSFHADIKAGEKEPWSMPGQVLWWTNFPPGSFSVEPYAENIKEGWYDPATTNWNANADTICWKYTFPVDPTTAFVQTGTVANAVVYWLDVQAQPQADPLEYHFGWKTTMPQFRWNDDACWAPAVEPYSGLWWEMHYPPGHPYHEWETNSFDLAFMLFGGPVEGGDEFDWGDAPDPSYPTLSTNAGASHLISAAGPWLGLVFPDSESDGQPTVLADGDDLNPPVGADDEDGVTFPPAAMTIGYPETVSLVVSGAAAGGYFVDGWIDWNKNGVWGDHPSEQIVTGTLPVGTTVLSVLPPPGVAVAGPTYARFRINSFGALGPAGPAADGEVEDYLVQVDEPDLGDAPDPSYPTLLASNGALHKIGPGPWLGGPLDTPDADPDGQPDPNALGDDLLDGIDDENGVVFPQLIVGQTGVLQVAVGNSTGGGFVDAWIDWNGDGVWQTPSERIISANLPFGVNLVPVVPPAGSTNGWTFARFRISSQGGLPPIGPAPNGEVEDYEVYLDVADFGDAPGGGLFAARYPTLLANTGAWHVVTSSIYLGAAIDGEADGQPTPSANGDDNTPPAGPDDEDGVVFVSGLYPGVPASLQVTAVGAGLLSVWLDVTVDGDWDDFGEQVIVDVPLLTGVNSVAFNVPVATAGPNYMRFRYSTKAGLGVRGGAPDGEVEDYQVVIADESFAFDYGDADGVYPVVLVAQNGARHVASGPANNYIMGAQIDSEGDGQFSPAADGDDVVLLDDEDGVSFPLDSGSNPVLVQGSNMTVQVVTPGTPWLSAWVDYNGDGDWNDSGETIAAALALSAGTNNLSVTAPVGAYLGPTHARFRTSSIATPLATTGPAPDGEVEDYLLDLCQPAPSSPVTLVITNFAVVTNVGAVMLWDCDPSLWTQPQACTNLVEASTNAAAWTSLTGLGTAQQHTDSSATNNPVRFYRVAAPYVFP